MTAAYPMRPIDPDEFPAFYAMLEQAFNSGAPTEAEVEHDRATFEFDRSLAAFDGSHIVGTAAALTFRLTVPGGMVAAAGVTAVAVLPSHRRRGILSGLMRRQLADIRDRGETLAVLFASEPAIYGRYGYGMAAAELDLTIRHGEGLIPEPPAASGPPPRLRIAEPRDARAELAKVYDAALRERPGTPARDDRWWESSLWDPEHRRSGGSALRCVIAEDDAGPRGYALFSVRPDWAEHGIPAGVLRVRELMATDPAAYAALWHDVLTRDLVAEVRARARPFDEPLQYLLADSRRARACLTDGLWVRLVSVPGALARRRYSSAVDVVIEVSDKILPENEGRWRLQSAGPAGPAGSSARAGDGRPGATCERTSAPADMALPVRALGAAYLGGPRLSALAAAGLVTEIRPGALAALSAALSWDPAPWCPMTF